MVDVTLRERRYTLGGRKQDSSLKIAIEFNFKVRTCTYVQENQVGRLAQHHAPDFKILIQRRRG